MDIENGGEGSGGGGGDDAGGGDGSASQSSGAGGTLLDLPANASNGGTDDSSSQGDDPLNWLPEKFRVKTEGDTPDVDIPASARKMAESYGALERRMKDGGAPPEKPDGYTVQVDGWDAMKQEPDVSAFLQNAHKVGMTNKQVELAVSTIMSAVARAEGAQSPYPVFDMNKTQAELREKWGSEDTYNKNINAAVTAAKVMFSPEERARYGNDPAIIRLLATVGADMTEDDVKFAGQPVELEETIGNLLQSEAYFDVNHKDHKKTHERVTNYYNRKYGTKDVQ